MNDTLDEINNSIIRKWILDDDVNESTFDQRFWSSYFRYFAKAFIFLSIEPGIILVPFTINYGGGIPLGQFLWFSNLN